jgi:hypothetical protein
MLRATVLITQENKMYDDALANFLEALSYFVVLENDKKIRKAFSGITDIVENHTPKPDSYEDGYELKESLNAAITALKEKNRLGKYNEKISYLESLIEESVKRYNEV